MELTTEQIQELKLNDDQVKGLSEIIPAYIAEQKKEWDGKANTDAQAILDDVAKGIESMTGIVREKGMKHKDYLSLASENYIKGQKSALEQKQAELEKKIAEGGDDLSKKEVERLKTQLEKVNGDIDKFKEKAAKYDELEQSGIQEKYKEAVQELSTIKLNTAFNQVKPSFPESVNKYEARAKWDDFVAGVKEKNIIELDKDGIAWAVDKDNEHKRVKLSQLVEKDKDLQTLATGRQITGFGNADKASKTIEGLPFAVPADATGKDVQDLIREHLAKEGTPLTARDYSTKFSELYNKWKSAK